MFGAAFDEKEQMLPYVCSPALFLYSLAKMYISKT